MTSSKNKKIIKFHSDNRDRKKNLILLYKKINSTNLGQCKSARFARCWTNDFEKMEKVLL